MSNSMPQLDKRKIWTRGNSIGITLHEDWMNQHWLETGDALQVILDKENDRFILTAEKIDTELPSRKREIKSSNTSAGEIYLPKDWVKELGLAKGDEIVMLSDNMCEVSIASEEKRKELHERFDVSLLEGEENIST